MVPPCRGVFVRLHFEQRGIAPELRSLPTPTERARGGGSTVTVEILASTELCKGDVNARRERMWLCAVERNVKRRCPFTT